MDDVSTTTPPEGMGTSPAPEAAAPAEQPADVQAMSAEPWREVGRQFKNLGETMAVAFRTAWENEENRRHLQAMQEGLETMVTEVSGAIKATATLPEGHQVREGAQKVMTSARVAGEKALQETRPHLLVALRQLDGELRKMIERMEAEKPAADVPPPPAPADESSQ